MVELVVKTLDGADAGKVTLSDSIFALEPRADVLQRMVRWQLARRQAGTHKTKGRAEIARTGKKLYKQKGTGSARHGSARVAQFRGGGRAFGPVVRAHDHDLSKKFRVLALKHALSAKLAKNELIILDKVEAAAPKTKILAASLTKLGLNNSLIIDLANVNENFVLASRNIPLIDVLPVEGVNVYDILRREKLVLTRASLEALEARLA